MVNLPRLLKMKVSEMYEGRLVNGSLESVTDGCSEWG